MYNNRAYYNDWEHQIAIAKDRGRDEEMAYLGMELDHPYPDFAKLAQSMGWHGEGPIEDPNQLGPAIERASTVAARRPTPMPATIRSMLFRTTRPPVSRAVAPSAIRSPISRVRWVTE